VLSWLKYVKTFLLYYLTYILQPYRVRDRTASAITPSVIRAKIGRLGKGSHGYRYIGSILSFLTALWCGHSTWGPGKHGLSSYPLGWKVVSFHVCGGFIIPTVERTPPAPCHRHFTRESVCVLHVPNKSASLGAKEERKGTNVHIVSQGHEIFLLGILKDISGLCWDGVFYRSAFSVLSLLNILCLIFIILKGVGSKWKNMDSMLEQT
jgi:hypothetical protein